MIIKIIIISILVAFFVFVAAYRKMLGWLMVPLTVCLALGILFTLKPEYTDQIAKLIGVGRGADLIIYLYILGGLGALANIGMTAGIYQSMGVT